MTITYFLRFSRSRGPPEFYPGHSPVLSFIPSFVLRICPERVVVVVVHQCHMSFLGLLRWFGLVAWWIKFRGRSSGESHHILISRSCHIDVSMRPSAKLFCGCDRLLLPWLPEIGEPGKLSPGFQHNGCDCGVVASDTRGCGRHPSYLGHNRSAVFPTGPFSVRHAPPRRGPLVRRA
jgi:hypothetical protein